MKRGIPEFDDYLRSMGYTRAQIRLFRSHPERIADTFGHDVAERIAADAQVFFDEFTRMTARTEATIW